MTSLGRREPLHNNYELAREVLGKGGAAYIVKAVHRRTGLERAIKVIAKKQSSSTETVEGLLQKSLSHPFVLRVYDMFEDRDNTYLVLEICQGGNLLERLVRWPLFCEADAAFIMQQILCAFRYMHKHDVLHGDVIPENILLTNSGPPSENAVKICDFGSAKRSLSHFEDLEPLGLIMRLLLSAAGSSSLAPPTGATISTSSGVTVPVSLDAKSLLDKLLTMNPYSDYTAGAALAHPWFKSAVPRKRSSRMPRSFVEKLSAFNAHSKLKKYALIVIADQLRGDLQHATGLFLSLNFRCDGMLTPYEIKRGLQKAKLEVPSNLKRLMKAVDVDGVGALDYTTFLAIMLESKMYQKEDMCRLAFCHFDCDGDGRASHAEIAEALWGRDENGKLISGPISEIVGEADVNGDGFVSFQEFADMMRTKSQLSSGARRSEKLATAAWHCPGGRTNIRNAKLAVLLETYKKSRKLDKMLKERLDKKAASRAASTICATVGSTNDIANIEDIEDILLDLANASDGSDADEESDADGDPDSDGFQPDSPRGEKLFPDASAKFPLVGAPQERELCAIVHI